MTTNIQTTEAQVTETLTATSETASPRRQRKVYGFRTRAGVRAGAGKGDVC